MGFGGGGGRKAKSEEDEGDLEVTIISRDGPDKLIVEHGARSVTFNWTRVTLAVSIQLPQKGPNLLKDSYKVGLNRNYAYDGIRVFTCCA